MIIHVPGKGLTAGVVLAGGEDGRGAGGVGEESQGGTLGCLGGWRMAWRLWWRHSITRQEVEVIM